MQSKFQVKFDPHKFHGDRGKVTIEYAHRCEQRIREIVFGGPCRDRVTPGTIKNTGVTSYLVSERNVI